MVCKSRARKGFTLIELLVVIAIIAILAAILFPVFIRAKEASYRSGCVTNMKQFAGALKMYDDNWNGFLFHFNYPYGDDDATDMVKVYKPYLRSLNAFVCPADKVFGGRLDPDDTNYLKNCSYAYDGIDHTPQADKGRQLDPYSIWPRRLDVEGATPLAKTQGTWVVTDIRYRAVPKGQERYRFDFNTPGKQDTATAHARVMWLGVNSVDDSYIPGLTCTRLYLDGHARCCKGWQRFPKVGGQIVDMP